MTKINFLFRKYMLHKSRERKFLFFEKIIFMERLSPKKEMIGIPCVTCIIPARINKCYFYGSKTGYYPDIRWIIRISKILYPLNPDIRISVGYPFLTDNGYKLYSHHFLVDTNVFISVIQIILRTLESSALNVV
jgi:hypothetical protein